MSVQLGGDATFRERPIAAPHPRTRTRLSDWRRCQERCCARKAPGGNRLQHFGTTDTCDVAVHGTRVVTCA